MFGSHDANIRALEAALGVTVSVTDTGVSISGDEHDCIVAGRVLKELYDLVGGGLTLQPEDVPRAVEALSKNGKARLKDLFLSPVVVTGGRSQILPKTVNQRAYVDAIRAHDIVFAIGPAGTGKTYLAMAMACAELFANRYERIILTRPAVEAGEKLGFLPGDLAEKVNPYLRPLYDALYDLAGVDKVAQMIERETVEVAPLAFMRGRTLSRAVIILDEAQNTTREQMKMLLTRMGYDSKIIVTGDITQVDLPSGQVSGLRDARDVLAGIAGIAFIHFDESDVVRHPLIKSIIGAYDRTGTRS